MSLYRRIGKSKFPWGLFFCCINFSHKNKNCPYSLIDRIGRIYWAYMSIDSCSYLFFILVINFYNINNITILSLLDLPIKPKGFMERKPSHKTKKLKIQGRRK